MNAIEIMNNEVKNLDEIQDLFKDYYFDYREKAEWKVSHFSTIKEWKDPFKLGTKPQTS